MPGFERLWENGPRFAQAEHFRLSTDCVLLADFVNTAGAVRGIDLGCASGAIALLLLTRTDKLHMTGLEIVPEAASLAEENMRANALEARSDIVCGDIRSASNEEVDAVGVLEQFRQHRHAGMGLVIL